MVPSPERFRSSDSEVYALGVLTGRPSRQYSVYVEYIHFTWSSTKDSQNQRKHGVSFQEARSAFFDEKARLMHDPDHSHQEDRFLLLGMSRRLRLLLVCHCYRESDEEIRIISARKATAVEAEQYWGY